MPGTVAGVPQELQKAARFGLRPRPRTRRAACLLGLGAEVARESKAATSRGRAPGRTPHNLDLTRPSSMI